MNNLTILTVILVVVVFIFSMLMSYFKRKVYLKLVSYIEKKNFEDFDIEISKWYIQFLFPQFNVEYMQLNSAILRNNPKMVEDSFAIFDKRHLNKKQKEAVYMMAFNYYISLEKYSNAKKYVDLINEIDNVQMKKEVNRIYDIYALNGYKYLDEMIEEVNMMEDTYKGVNEFLISLMYENKGDKDKAEEFKKLSEKHMKLLDRKISNSHKKDK